MDEMEKRFSNVLDLSEREAQGIQFDELIKDSARKLPHALICRVLKEKRVHNKSFIDLYSRVWKGHKGVKISEAEDGRFLVEFNCADDMNEVLADEPWEFDNCLIVMAPLNEARTSLDVPLFSTPFWVQVTNVPLKYRVRKVAIGIASMLGEFVDALTDDKDNCIGKHVCIRVRIRIDQPLVRKTCLEFPDVPKGMIHFIYERLPSFCQECGKLDHPTKTCFVKLGLINVPERNRKFQLSLRAETDVFGKRISYNMNHFSKGVNKSNFWSKSSSGAGTWKKRTELSEDENGGRDSGIQRVEDLHSHPSTSGLNVDLMDSASSPLKLSKHPTVEVPAEVSNQHLEPKDVPDQVMVVPNATQSATAYQLESGSPVRLELDFEKSPSKIDTIKTSSPGPVKLHKVRRRIVTDQESSTQGLLAANSKRPRSEEDESELPKKKKSLLVPETFEVMGAAGLPHHEQ